MRPTWPAIDNAGVDVAGRRLVQFCVLGRISLVGDDGEEHPLGTTREAALLADLVAHAGDVMASARLIDDLWRGRPPPGAAGTLQTYVKNLRRFIAGVHGAPTVERVLQTVQPGYVLRVAPDDVDAGRAQRLHSRARAALAGGDHQSAARLLTDVISLWKGRAYGELADETYLHAEASRLDDLRLVAIEELIDVELVMGRESELTGRLEALIAEHPYRERLWGQLMLALYRTGRQAEALRAYQRLRHRLGEELGIEPGKVIEDLEVAILRHEPRLDRSPLSPPGPRSVAPPRRLHLPMALSRFVGRVAELEEIAERLPTTRLLTLTGSGGVGKTRLALETARRVQSAYRGGAWMFELASTNDETGVVATIATALGMTATGVDDVAAGLRLIVDHLSSRQALLVFDNCEHVVVAIATVIETLLAGCPDVSVRATSRERLRLPGELAWTVPSLGLPPADQDSLSAAGTTDAVMLFTERAREARSDFRLTEENVSAVGQICRRLDGIPLALELAAARVRLLTVSQIAARLDVSFDLLTGGARTALPRQKTLRATLDWSYELLAPIERDICVRLAVFPDWFTIDAAIQIAAEPVEAAGLDVLTALVDKSLVIVDSTGEQAWFRLLEPVRQYAAEKFVATGDEDALRRAHRDYFLIYARACEPFLPETRTWRLGRDQANFLAALEYSWRRGELDASLVLCLVLSSTRVLGREVDGRRWFERVVAAPQVADNPTRARCLCVLALIIHESRQPDPARSLRLVDEAMATAGRIGDRGLTAWLRYNIAELRLVRGERADARQLLESAARWFDENGDRLSAGWCAERLGWVAIIDGEPDKAQECFERAATLAHDGDDRWLAAHALAAVGPLRVTNGDRIGGERAAADAVVLARQIKIESLLVMALTRAAEAAILAGSYEASATFATELLGLLRGQPSRRWFADALEIAAIVVANRGDDEGADEFLRSAEALRGASGETAGGSRSLAPTVQRLRARLRSGRGPVVSSPMVAELAMVSAHTALTRRP